MEYKVSQCNDSRLKSGQKVYLSNNGYNEVRVLDTEVVKQYFRLFRTVVTFHTEEMKIEGFHKEQNETFTEIEIWLK